MDVTERHGIGGQERTARRNRHLRDLAIGSRAHHHQAVLGGAARNREAPGLAGRRQVGEVDAHAGFVANRHARLRRKATAAVLAQPVEHAAVVRDRERGKGRRARRVAQIQIRRDVGQQTPRHPHPVGTSGVERMRLTGDENAVGGNRIAGDRRGLRRRKHRGVRQRCEQPCAAAPRHWGI